MKLKNLLTAFYSRFSGQPKPQSELDQYMTDEGLKQHIEAFETAFPNYELIIQDLVEEDNKVVARVLFRGVHSGFLGELPPTSKRVELPFIAIYEFRDDKIVNHWIAADQMALLTQLQAEPEMAV